MYLAITTDVVQTAADIHRTSNVATAALGRVVTAAGLMGLMLQDDRSTLTLQIKGDGPAAEILASADATGRVRGYIQSGHRSEPKGREARRRKSGGHSTHGHQRPEDEKPYIGRIDLTSGEIAEDLTVFSEVGTAADRCGARCAHCHRRPGRARRNDPAAFAGRVRCVVDRLERRIATLGSLTDHIAP